MRVMTRASSRTGARSTMMCPALRAVPKCSTVWAAARRKSAVAAMMTASHETRRRRFVRGLFDSALFDIGALLSQGAAGALGDEAVEADGGEDERADDGLLPERGDAEDRQRVVDDGEQECAQGRAEDGAGAAEDGDAADDDGRDDVEFQAVPGGGVDGAEAGRVEDAAESGEQAAEGVGLDEASALWDAGERGGLGIGAEGVQVAAGSVKRTAAAMRKR
jgi:hypothetical protein